MEENRQKWANRQKGQDGQNGIKWEKWTEKSEWA